MRWRDFHWGVVVELCQSGSRNLISSFSDICLPTEELCGQIGDLDRGWVVEGDGFHTGETDVFCYDMSAPFTIYGGLVDAITDLNTKSLESNDQDIRLAHAFHRLMSKHVPTDWSAGIPLRASRKTSTADDCRVPHRWWSSKLRPANRSASLWYPKFRKSDIPSTPSSGRQSTMVASFSGRTRMSFEAFLFDTLEEVD